MERKFSSIYASKTMSTMMVVTLRSDEISFNVTLSGFSVNKCMPCDICIKPPISFVPGSRLYQSQ